MAEDTRLTLSEEPGTGPDCDDLHMNSNETNDIKINIQQPTARTEQSNDHISDDNPDSVLQDTLKVPERNTVDIDEENTNEQPDHDENENNVEKSENVNQDEHNDTEDEEDKRIEEENRLIEELKIEMHNSVKKGDLSRLEELLNSPHADINMTLYNENLLITALKAGEEFLSEYLIDNGVDYNFQLVYLDLKDEDDRKYMEWYKISCRQLAFDRDMIGIVELIDLKNENLFDFVNPACRVPKIWQPKPVEIEPAVESEEHDENNRTTTFEIEDESKTEDAHQTKTAIRPGKSISVLSDVDSGQYSGWKYQSNKRVPSDNNIEQSSAVHTTSQHCLSPDEGYETTSPILSACTSPLGKRSKFRSAKVYFNAPTKSSILKSNYALNKRSISNETLPDVFQTTRVVSPGSYHYESKLWHVVNEKGKSNRERSAILPDMSAPVRTQSPWRNDVTSHAKLLSSNVNTKHSTDLASRRSLPCCYDSSGLHETQSLVKRPTRPKVVKSVSYNWTGKSVMKREQSCLQGHYSTASRSTNSSISSRRLLRSGSKIQFRPLTM